MGPRKRVLVWSFLALLCACRVEPESAPGLPPVEEPLSGIGHTPLQLPPATRGIPNQRLQGQRSLSLDLKTYFQDDRDAANELTYEVASFSEPARVLSYRISSGVLTIQFAPDAGTVEITLRVTDRSGNAGQQRYLSG